ncbi:MAG: TnpV protein [Clostridia bacterium]|nr:TnpV protein [Clostridia bacterium]
MKERFIENGIEYVKSGDYYIPNLKAPEGTYNISRYGKLHSIFIKENRPAFYSMKMLNGTWLAYLEEIDTSAKEMVDRLIEDMMVKQGITEELKVKDQMAWVGAMNNIRHSAEEIVLQEFICSMEVQ